MLNHILLTAAWIIFSFLHSLFATQSFKTKMQFILKEKYKFYRILYSLFALMGLMLILFYNFSMQSILLWYVYGFEKIVAVTAIVLSASLMLIFNKRFFIDLSGANVFQKRLVGREFIQSGFYKHVRHPLFSATIVFVWSIFLYQPFLSNLITCICITIYTLIGISFEEKKLVNEFGKTYVTYQSTTPMLIPKVISARRIS